MFLITRSHDLYVNSGNIIIEISLMKNSLVLSKYRETNRNSITRYKAILTCLVSKNMDKDITNNIKLYLLSFIFNVNRKR